MVDKALVIVDLQKDFCPGGALAVKECSSLIKKINAYIEKFKEMNLPIIASRDWHPVGSNHFEKFGGKWPEHCIQNTKGAEFHSDLRLAEETIVISKGVFEGEDGYSAFEGRDDRGRLLDAVLKQIGVKELYICGVATDYCVKSTAVDAADNYQVYLLEDAIEGVEVNEGDTKKALDEMTERGIRRLTLDKLKI
jgi:nicotinamidase/pyrazinamidase